MVVLVFFIAIKSESKVLERENFKLRQTVSESLQKIISINVIVSKLLRNMVIIFLHFRTQHNLH